MNEGEFLILIFVVFFVSLILYVVIPTKEYKKTTMIGTILYSIVMTCLLIIAYNYGG